MKIVVIPPDRKLDYLAESVIEGMYKCGVEIISSQLGNGIREEDVYSESGVLSHVEDCDYVFAIWGKRNGGYPGIDYDMVIKTGAPHKTAYIDGSEWTFNGHPNVGQVSDSKSNPKLRRGEPWINQEMYDYCQWYFKRECYQIDADMGIIPLPFVAVDRYKSQYSGEKDIDILCMFGQVNDGLRKEVVEVCTKLKSEGHRVLIGSGMSYEKYKEAIVKSYIVIDAWGGGDTCARFWEATFNKSCLFSQKYNILMPNKFTDAVNFVEYSTIEEFEEKIRYYLDHNDECIEIGNAGYNHTVKYHVGDKQFEYIMKNLN